MLNPLKIIFNNKQNKETFWATISKGIFIVSGMFLLYIIPNKIGVVSYGEFTLIFSYIYLLQIFFGNVFVSTINKEVTENKFKATSKLFFIESLKISLLFFLVSSILLFPIANYFKILTITDNYFYFLSMMFVVIFSNFMSKLFEYTHRLFFVALMYGIEYSLKIIAIGIFLYKDNLNLQTVLISFILGYFISSLVALILSLITFEKNNKQKLFGFEKQVFKKIIGRAFFLGLSGLSMIIISKIDTIMISSLLDKSAVGYYGIASEISKKASVASLPIVMGVFPLFALSKRNKKLFKDTMIKLILINLAILVFFLVFSKPIIVLLYGEEFTQSVLILKVLSLLPMLINVQGLAQQLLILEDSTKSILTYSIIGAILSVILDYFFINCYGMIGAAIATDLVYIIWSVLCMYKLKKLEIF